LQESLRDPGLRELGLAEPPAAAQRFVPMPLFSRLLKKSLAAGIAM
jgi:hypothetical protein